MGSGARGRGPGAGGWCGWDGFDFVGGIRPRRVTGFAWMQEDGPGGERNLNAFLLESPEDPLPKLMPHAKLARKLVHVKSHGEGERGIAETRVEGHRWRRIGQ